MGVTSLSRDGIAVGEKYTSALAGNDTADIALSSDFLIQEVVLNGNTTSVIFDVSTLAAQGYKHLQVRVVNRTNQSTYIGNITVRFNGDSGTNYWNHFLNGAGSSVSSFQFQESQAYVGQSTGTSASSGVYNSFITDILDPFSTTKKKTIRSLFGTYVTSSEKQVGIISNLWNSTSAITSITIRDSGSSSFIAGSRFSLYGSKG